MKRITGIYMAGALLAAAGVSPALAGPWYGDQFSADITMVSTKDRSNAAQGKIFVGTDWVRAEGHHGGQSKVVLMNPTKKAAWTMDPAARTFHRGLGDAPPPMAPDEEVMPSDPESPCKTQQETRCQLAGNEQINGRQTEKWTITRSHQGQSMQMTMWVDPALHIIIRREFQNGPTMNRVFKGIQEVQGRSTEVWEITHSFKEKSQTLTQWVDRPLKMVVGMSGAGDYTMSLTNIQVGPQPASLFQIPRDFQEVQPPKPKEQQGQGSYRR